MPEYEKADPMNPDTFNEHNTFWTGSGIRSTFEHISQEKWDKVFKKQPPMKVNFRINHAMRIAIAYKWHAALSLTDMDPFLISQNYNARGFYF